MITITTLGQIVISLYIIIIIQVGINKYKKYIKKKENNNGNRKKI